MQTKKLLLYFLSFLVLYGCSTSNDSNGNSTTTVVPAPPTSLTGTVISTTQINLSWTDNSTNETGFKIERKTGTGTYAVVGAVNADILTYTDLGLTPNITYTYRIYSYNAAGNSPTYSNEVTLTTTINPTYTQGPNITDIDGNTYQSITNCSQTWTKQNLNASKYTDGTPIPQVTDPTQWANLTTGAWCYYNNDPANGAIYGKLYNWYAAAGVYNTASLSDLSLRKKLTPIGWHVPSQMECFTLISCLDPNSNGGPSSIAGMAMRETGTSHWLSPNTDANNSSGFTGLPGGYRANNGIFADIGNKCYWQIYTMYSSSSDDWFGLTTAKIANYSSSAPTTANGFSVRCIKD